MIKRRDQADMARKQHAITEYIARHIADTDHSEIRRLGIEPHLARMPLHRLPRAARGDRHSLVVVAY